MNKIVEFGTEARNKINQGVNTLANAVTSTLGPNGRNVIIEQDMGNPISTKDGVTVAKSIKLKDKLANTGAQIVKQAAIKTAEQAGDGTTTSTLLASQIYKDSLAALSTSNNNAVEIKRGIDQGVKDVIEYLRSISEKITDEKKLKEVATISANNDTEVGNLIALAVDKVGQDGVITLEESKTGDTYLEVVEGIQFNRGYKSPYFVTDNSNMSVTLNDPYILMTDKRLSSIKELLPILESVSTQNKSLLIIADDVDGEALSTLVVNKVRGILNVVAVRAPEFGDRKKLVMEDIAVLTGGQVITADKGMRMDKFDMTWLGRARKVTVDKDNTTIIDGKGSEDALIQRVNDLRTQIENAASPFEKEQLQERLGRLAGGVAVVHVGGQTEIEMKEKKDRVEDALHATRAALEEGILPGGGVALLKASQQLTRNLHNSSSMFENQDRKSGYRLLTSALEAPFKKIMINAGADYMSTISRMLKILDSEDTWLGYDPRQEEFRNFMDAGIVDPTKVTRLALENAASVAGTLLTTECVIVNEEEENKNNNINPMDY